MEESSRQKLDGIASSIVAKVTDLLSEAREFKTMIESYDSEDEEGFDDAHSALNDCLVSVDEASTSLGEAEFALNSTDKDEEDDEEE
jgi:hypothetical protein